MTVSPPATEVAPRDVARGVAGSAVAQIGAKITHLALNIVSTLAVVRYLAPGAYGVYALVLTVTTLVALVADFGLPKLAVREICARAGDEDEIIGTIVVVRLGLAVGAVGLTQLVMLLLQQSGVAHVAAAVGSLAGVGEAVVAAVVVVFQVRLVQQWEAFVRTGTELLETAAILILVAQGAGLVWLFVPPALGTALAAVLVVAVARHRFARRFRFGRTTAGFLLRQAAPIAPALVIGVLYRKLDSLTLAAMRTPRDVGLYGSAAQPIEYAFLTTALLMNVIFPLMSGAFSRGDLDRFADLYRRGAESLVIVTVAAPVLLVFVARPLVTDVFGAPYVGSAVPLLLLAVAMVPLTVNVWQSLALLVGGFQAVTLRYNLAALAVAAVLCPVLIARFGLLGAGLAAVGTAAFVLAASTWSVRRHLHVGLHRGAMTRIGVAAALTAALLTALVPLRLPWPAVAAAGVAAFVVALRLTGAHRSLTGVVA